MELSHLKMAPFNSTLMGMLRGVLDYYGLEASDAMLYGASGQAFLMNIHKELCPSGPYCWDRRPFYALARNLGVQCDDLGFFGGDSSAGERAGVETVLSRALDSGLPCGLVNMEYQLITGRDETGFLTARPWACNTDYPPGRLTFGTWDEMGGDVHVTFYTFAKLQPADREKAVADSLAYAVDLCRNPQTHSGGDYSVGDGAYARWITAVEAGHGNGHGNWWNATVWGECRARASDYFAEIAGWYTQLAPAAQELSQRYRAIGEALTKVSDRELPAGEKLQLLKQAADLEAGCVKMIERLEVPGATTTA